MPHSVFLSAKTERSAVHIVPGSVSNCAARADKRGGSIHFFIGTHFANKHLTDWNTEFLNGLTMKLHFRNILVYLPAGTVAHAAIENAMAVASADNSTITCVDVVRPLSSLWDSIVSDEERKERLDRRIANLEATVSPFQQGEHEIITKVLRGVPAAALGKEVDAGDYDLVIKQGSGDPPERIFGSVDFRLARHCSVPLLLTQTGAESDWEDILVAIDPEAGEFGMKLNHKLIRQASAVARVHKAKLHVVCGWSKTAFMFDGYGGNLTDDGYQAYVEKGQRRVHDIVKAIADKSLYRVDADNITIESGQPANVIMDALEAVKPDLLVMGGIGRSAICGFLMGNTTERVIRRVRCSIMTVKP